MNRPKVNSEGQRQLDRAEESFKALQEEIKDFNPLDGKKIPEVEVQTKLSDREAKKADAPVIKPLRSIKRPQGGKDGAKVFWDEKNRAQWEYDWQLVRCIVENHEIIGESVPAWTSKWGCDNADYWMVPVNKPIMIPRHLAVQLSKCCYHRLIMEDRPVEQSHMGTITGAMTVDHVKHRINCRPVGFDF